MLTSIVPCMYSAPKAAASRAARSVRVAKDAEEVMDLNMNYVMAGMMLTLFVLFLAEGICASIRKER